MGQPGIRQYEEWIQEFDLQPHMEMTATYLNR